MGGIVPFFPEIKAPPIKAEPVFQAGPLVFTNSMLGALVALVVIVILILVIIFRPKGILGGGGLAIIRPRWWPAAWTLRKHGAAAEA